MRNAVNTIISLEKVVFNSETPHKKSMAHSIGDVAFNSEPLQIKEKHTQ